ncbi:hypothetical protein [uncultured Amnibacterium sp.]|uniref:hypothetical protein n=1 Tax=uncultured Amnibacterium sp. TaxID=1631851 RepID=UPI0035CA0641
MDAQRFHSVAIPERVPELHSSRSDEKPNWIGFGDEQDRIAPRALSSALSDLI